MADTVALAGMMLYMECVIARTRVLAKNLSSHEFMRRNNVALSCVSSLTHVLTDAFFFCLT